MKYWEYILFQGIYKEDLFRSVRGTVRGVKNRVRAGIATFLQDQTSKVTFRSSWSSSSASKEQTVLRTISFFHLLNHLSKHLSSLSHGKMSFQHSFHNLPFSLSKSRGMNNVHRTSHPQFTHQKTRLGNPFSSLWKSTVSLCPHSLCSVEATSPSPQDFPSSRL